MRWRANIELLNRKLTGPPWLNVEKGLRGFKSEAGEVVRKAIATI